MSLIYSLIFRVVISQCKRRGGVLFLFIFVKIRFVGSSVADAIWRVKIQIAQISKFLCRLTLEFNFSFVYVV